MYKFQEKPVNFTQKQEKWTGKHRKWLPIINGSHKNDYFRSRAKIYFLIGSYRSAAAAKVINALGSM